MNSKNSSENDLSLIDHSLINLKNHIESKNYKGWDPYDCLRSPLFKLPILKSSKYFRFLSQQFLKRFPFNLRKFLFIDESLNPVTLGLSLQAYSQLYEIDKTNKDQYLKKIEDIILKLEKLIPKGYAGACWGYDFDWEARYMKVPAYQPTIVATGIISNALYIAFKATKIQRSSDLVISASNFVKTNLYRTIDENGICLSYSPFDKEKVFNASMKGARLLAQTFDLNNDKSSLKLSRDIIKYVMRHQNTNGSWSYSLSKSGGWIDNYHTGYILDCLDEYQSCTKDCDYKKQLEKGVSFYKENFVTKDFIPKFYNYDTYPVDCTSAAQFILSMKRFGHEEIAQKVANWMILNMMKEDGSFKFRKFKYYSIDTSYMRWSNAWMFAALSFLKKNKNQN